VGCDFQGLERLYVKVVVEPGGKFRSDPRNGPEQGFGLERAAQPVELRPPAGRDQLGEGGGNAAADVRQRDQGFAAPGCENTADRLVEVVDRICRPMVGGDAEAIGVLLGEQIGLFAQRGCESLIGRGAVGFHRHR
jgi:hypothetical protein